MKKISSIFLSACSCVLFILYAYSVFVRSYAPSRHIHLLFSGIICIISLIFVNFPWKMKTVDTTSVKRNSKHSSVNISFSFKYAIILYLASIVCSCLLWMFTPQECGVTKFTYFVLGGHPYFLFIKSVIFVLNFGGIPIILMWKYFSGNIKAVIIAIVLTWLIWFLAVMLDYRRELIHCMKKNDMYQDNILLSYVPYQITQVPWTSVTTKKR